MEGRTRLVMMDAEQVVGSGGWTEVYTLAGNRPFLHSFIVQLNTNKMLLRVTIDDEVTVDADLEVLSGDFQIAKLLGATLTSYHSKKWVFQPPVAQWSNGGFKIELRSKSGNKRLERGFVVWGEK